jgi:hypothetical protein
MFCRSLFVLFVPFLLTIVLSDLLQYTASDYPFWYLQTCPDSEDTFRLYQKRRSAQNKIRQYYLTELDPAL